MDDNTTDELRELFEELHKMVEHLPREEQLEALHNFLLSDVEDGLLIAFQDGEDLRYKAPVHCEPHELEMALTLEQLKEAQRQTRLRIAGGWN